MQLSRMACAVLLLSLGGVLSASPGVRAAEPVADWPQWGGTEGGTRYSPLTQITPANIGKLKRAWTYHIGTVEAPEFSSPTLEGTPLVVDGRMFICSGMGKVAAIDPETGQLAGAEQRNAIFEYFFEENAPRQGSWNRSTGPGGPRTDEFIRDIF